MDLTTPLTYVKGIGPARAAMLEAKGLTTVEDLLGSLRGLKGLKDHQKDHQPSRHHPAVLEYGRSLKVSTS
jgi:hypothetical protein